MTSKAEIRQSTSADTGLIKALYPQAFPDEDLLPVVGELLNEGEAVLSLVALSNGEIAGHVIFTICGIEGGDGKVGLLGPLGVAPAAQQQGTGSALVRTGLEMLAGDGVSHVCVLGDPGYYGRFGFEREDAIRPPYELPQEWHGAWQSLSLDGAAATPGGKLLVPRPWRHEALWLP